MARDNRDPADLLRLFEAAREVASEETIVNLRELAEVLKMTDRNVKLRYIDPDPDFPVENAGSEGKSYQFRLVTVLDHLIAKAKARIESSRKHNEQHARAAGVQIEAENNNVAVLSLAELAKLAQMTMQVQEWKKSQGELIEASKMADFLAKYNTLVVNGILGVSSKVDPTSILPLDVRREMDEELRNLAVMINAEAKKFIGELRADIQQARIAS